MPKPNPDVSWPRERRPGVGIARVFSETTRGYNYLLCGQVSAGKDRARGQPRNQVNLGPCEQ